MAREAAYELTDAEKRDLIKLIEQGKPLPEKYRFLRFEDKREVELLWYGKTREVCTAILPFDAFTGRPWLPARESRVPRRRDVPKG
jgi:site-specific DNA-methyltransferase (adenine-specific)/adenine-specific DNA-methyltransferase